MPTFDWTVSVGNLLSAAIVIGGWFYAFFKLQGDVRIIKHDQKQTDTKVNLINDNINTLTSILTKVAVQEERFISFGHRIEVSEQDIRDLQNGIGFKTERMTGEYSRHGKIL